MIRFLMCAALIWGSVFCLSACTTGADEKTLRFECEDQFQGEACWKLGKAREGEDALKYFRMGCEKQSTKACLSVSEHSPDKEEAKKALQQACGWKSPEACAKLKEVEGEGKAP